MHPGQREECSKLAPVDTVDLLFWETPFGLGSHAPPRFSTQTRRLSSDIIAEGIGRILEIMIGLYLSSATAKPTALGNWQLFCSG